ncbi:MAG: Leu/Phe/Val dehydrogenase [Deltaproteobacteria bacterium]
MELFAAMSEAGVREGGYEGVHFLHDRPSGLRAIVAIHSTRLGPALGGTRALSTYPSEEAALVDVLRLARGMTYKAALSGVPHGGGKAVILLPKGPFDRARLFQAFGRAVETLGGRYITTEDSGTSPDDMEHVRHGTRYVVGQPPSKGGSGDPSPVTAFGVLRGIEAVARFALGRGDLKGLRVALLGVGHVGFALAKLLHDAGATLAVADVDPEKAERARRELGCAVRSTDEIIGLECDVFSPNALGAILNDETIPRLRCRAVAGAANNQLAEPRHGAALSTRGILYAPDYAINAGGLINVALEWSGYDEAKARAGASRIYDTLLELFARAKAEGRDPASVADSLAEDRLRVREPQAAVA